MRKTLVLLPLFLFLAATSQAQTYLNATGSPTFVTPERVELGYINLANGNLHLQLSFGTWPQRGAIPFSAGMVYDSRIWQIVNNQWQPTNVPNSMAGWRFATSVDAGTVSYTTNTSPCSGGNLTTYSVFLWTDPNGTQRAFPITTSQNTCTGQNVTSGDAFASDSSGFHMYVTNYTSATVFAKTGDSYSDTTPAVTYGYDDNACNGVTPTNGLNRRTCMTDGSGVTERSYDPAGNIVSEKRAVASITETTSDTYNLDGSVATKTYASGHVVTNTYGNAQRIIAVQNTATHANYATSVTYAPQGEFSSMINGLQTGIFAGITYTRNYNNRLQITHIKASSSAGTVLDLSYSYDQGGGINNGNRVSETNNKAGASGRSQSYTYDSLNRIASAQTQATSGTGCWGLSYGYDRYANLLAATVTQCSATGLDVTVDTKNQITNMGFQYDAAGNMTNDGSHTYGYDAENRLKSFPGVTYTYDGDGYRVAQSNGDDRWYDQACGHLLPNKINPTGGAWDAEYYYLGNLLIGSGSHFYYSDPIGSPRVLTDVLGNLYREVDFQPYGGEVAITGGSGDDTTVKFSGKRRDPESGFDYSHLRMMDSAIARWTSADPIRGDTRMPQSFNRYNYVIDRPTTLVDPTGGLAVQPREASRPSRAFTPHFVGQPPPPSPPPPVPPPPPFGLPIPTRVHCVPLSAPDWSDWTVEEGHVVPLPFCGPDQLGFSQDDCPSRITRSVPAPFNDCADNHWTLVMALDCSGDRSCCEDKVGPFRKRCDDLNDAYDRLAHVKRYVSIPHYDLQVTYAVCCKRW